jgi:putative phosphotransacetylase
MSARQDKESMAAERVPAVRMPVVVCERHVHLTQDIVEQLFCDKYQLHVVARVSQPTQFAARELVTLVGPRGRIPNVRVIGPARADNQIEISQTDGRVLGIPAPVRESGDIKDTPGVVIEGPRASVRLDHGVIRALRHIHMDPLEAERDGLKDGDRIDVAKDGAYPHTLFCDVLVRVSPAFRTELHLDPDEGSAAGLESGCYVALKPKTQEPV